jgi:hypothetical protein
VAQTLRQAFANDPDAADLAEKAGEVNLGELALEAAVGGARRVKIAH